MRAVSFDQNTYMSPLQELTSPVQVAASGLMMACATNQLCVHQGLIQHKTAVAVPSHGADADADAVGNRPNHRTL